MVNNFNITKLIFSIVFYIGLLIPFVWFYMYDQLSDFIEGSTTIASRFEISPKIEFPTMTFCTTNVFKRSVVQKFGFKTNYEIFWKNIPNKTLEEAFDELSFQLNRDFIIKASHDLWWHQSNLTIGLNNITLFNHGTHFLYDVQPLKTYYQGTCYKIQPLFEATYVPTFISFMIQPISEHLYDGFYLYFTSNDTWQGIILNMWPRFDPSYRLINDIGKTHDFQVKPVEYILNEEHKNTSKGSD